MIEFKLVGVGFAFAALSQVANSALQVVIIVGALATALLAIASVSRRAYRFISKADKGIDLLFHLDHRFASLEGRLEQVEVKQAKAERAEAKLRDAHARRTSAGHV